MVPGGNKAKRLSSVNHTTKIMHQFNSSKCLYWANLVLNLERALFEIKLGT